VGFSGASQSPVKYGFLLSFFLYHSDSLTKPVQSSHSGHMRICRKLQVQRGHIPCIGGLLGNTNCSDLVVNTSP
jgi:hypothetical protein